MVTMATGSSDSIASYEQCVNLPIKQESPDDNCPEIPDCWSEDKSDTKCSLHVTDEKLEQNSVRECLFPKNPQNQSEMCASSIVILKTECPVPGEATQVKQELEYISSTSTDTFDPGYEEEKYKIDIKHHLLTDDPDQDKNCNNRIERFSLAYDTGQPHHRCQSCGQDNCKQDVVQAAWKTQVQDHIKLERCAHASPECKISESSLHKVMLCEQKTHKGEEDDIDGSVPTTSKHHVRQHGEGLLGQQVGESDQHNNNNGSHDTNKTYLRGHVTRMHGKDTKVYYCATCNYNTKCPSNFSHHQVSKHNIDINLYKCEECDFTTRSRCYLYTHARIKHNPDARVYGCSQCEYTTKYKTHLKAHVKLKHHPGSVACAQCGPASTNDDNSCRHAKPELFRCSECLYTTKYKKHLKRHVTVKHDPDAQVYRCSECQYTTKYTAKLSTHIRVRHDPHVELYKCSTCTFTTKYKTTLVEHANVRHNSAAQVYECSMCAFTTRARKFLLQHVRLKHNPDVKVYRCSECGYTTKHKTRLSEHTNARHNPDPELFRCSECDFTTKHRTALCEHAKIRHNAGAKVYGCADCGFTTKWKRSLAGHRKSQHGPMEKR